MNSKIVWIVRYALNEYIYIYICNIYSFDELKLVHCKISSTDTPVSWIASTNLLPPNVCFGRELLLSDSIKCAFSNTSNLRVSAAILLMQEKLKCTVWYACFNISVLLVKITAVLNHINFNNCDIRQFILFYREEHVNMILSCGPPAERVGNLNNASYEISLMSCFHKSTSNVIFH